MIEPESERSDSNDERNNGVSSLEPSFQRALFTRPGAIQSQLETRKHDAGAFVVPAASSLPQNPPEPTGLRDQGQRDIVRAPADDTTPLPVGAINEALNSQASEELRTRKDGQSPTGANSAPVVHVDVVTTETRATPDSFSPVTEERHDSPAVISPLDQTPWVAAIPRCCDTCREFQRDPDGKTGYCGSPYAMGKRTMVKSDQLACRSSIGVWWLPSDDTWLDRADISHHTRPTPYLDAVLGDLRPGSR